MLFPKNSVEKLGFSQILQWTKDRCTSELGKNLCSQIKFSTDATFIISALNQTEELKTILEKGALNLNLNIDIDLKREKAHLKGFYYLEEELPLLADFIGNLEMAIAYFRANLKVYPALEQLLLNIDLPENLSDEIKKVLSIDGTIKPNATKELAKINADIDKQLRSISANSQRIFEKSKSSGYTADTELTLKNGRIVIPVLAEHKRKVQGILVDQSATGKIFYIEPSEIVELNNDLAELQIKQRQEIIKILKKVSATIVPHIAALHLGQRRLALWDVIRAKASISIAYNCLKPEITNDTTTLINAIHPILKQRLILEGGTPIPLSLSLNKQERIIVISGPNAGGKSVTLKTVGLLQLMFQHGYLVPCMPGSAFRIFENIFIDIGDDQSIESDLSTYSSHLKAAKHIVNFSNENTLVLMDEIGTGTDPQLGGPMAEAVLEEIHDTGAQGIITTHFSNVKTRAKVLKHTVNAAMLFDTEKLQPLYKLSVGQAGSSFTYEVAQKIGLNRKIIKKAKKYTDTRQYDLDKMLAEVIQQKELLAQNISDLNVQKEEAQYYLQEYKSLKETIELQQKDLINQAKKQASEILQDANKTIENTIRAIKENKADSQKTKVLREKLQSKKVEVQVEELPIVSEFKEGQRVQIAGTNSIGEIKSVNKDKVTLDIGGMLTKTSISKIEKIGQQSKEKIGRYLSSKSFTNRQNDFSTTLDVRGLRTNEALEKVDQWLDSAIILGFQELRLVHGKGDGILRNQIRTHLKPNTAIDKINYAHQNSGGEGVSIISLR